MSEHDEFIKRRMAEIEAEMENQPDQFMTLEVPFDEFCQTATLNGCKIEVTNTRGALGIERVAKLEDPVTGDSIFVLEDTQMQTLLPIPDVWMPMLKNIFFGGGAV